MSEQFKQEKNGFTSSHSKQSFQKLSQPSRSKQKPQPQPHVSSTKKSLKQDYESPSLQQQAQENIKQVSTQLHVKAYDQIKRLHSLCKLDLFYHRYIKNQYQIIQYSATYNQDKEEITMTFFAVKLESDQLNRILLSTFNKNPKQSIKLKSMYSSIFIEKELSALSDQLKSSTQQLKLTIQKIQFPIKEFQSSSSFQNSKRLLVFQRTLQKHFTVDLRLVKAFRIWQKDLLDKYLDMLSNKMRQTKKSILNQRFQFISQKLKLKLRKAFKKWALISQNKSTNVLTLQSIHYKQHFGSLKVLNKFMTKKKEAMSTSGGPSKSLLQAFQIWKMNSKYSIMKDWDICRRGQALNGMRLILEKHIKYAQCDCFWTMKDLKVVLTKKTIAKKQLLSITNNNNQQTLYRSIGPIIAVNNNAKVLAQLILERNGRQQRHKVAKYFKTWKLYSTRVRENHNQSMRAINNQSYKRRWENPVIKQSYNGKKYSLMILHRFMYQEWVWTLEDDHLQESLQLRCSLDEQSTEPLLWQMEEEQEIERSLD